MDLKFVCWLKMSPYQALDLQLLRNVQNMIFTTSLTIGRIFCIDVMFAHIVCEGKLEAFKNDGLKNS